MSIYDKASLVLIPSGTKTSKVYSQKPVNGDGDFTFSRSTAATRVNADGNIEKETQNLLLQSNSFDTASWGGAVTTTSGQSGYDGTSNAWLIQNAAASAYIRQNNTTSGVLTASIYAKAGNANWMRFAVSNSPVVSIYFDLVNGVGYGASNLISHDIEDVGNGWHRYSVAFLASSMSGMQWYPADGNNDLGEVGDNIYIQDAQVEQGLVARDYIETTTAAVEGGITDNVPRLDYTDSSCPALLLEPQRTNLYTYSEYGGIWNKTLATITDNYAISPEGVKNAFRANFSNNSGLIYVSGTGATGQDNTLSVWAKSNTGTDQVFRFFANGNTIKSDNFTATNEWQRFTYTHNCTNVTAGITGNSAGGLSDILFYGFQQEAGSYATSYIPTYGTSVTRNRDNCDLNDVSNIRGDRKGTLYVEGKLSTIDTGGVMALTYGGGTAGLVYIWIRTNGQIIADIYTNNVYESSLNTGNNFIDVGDSFKIAVAYQDNDAVLYINGNFIESDNDLVAPNPNLLRIGKYNAAGYTGGSYTNAMVFPTRLSNEELAALTTI